MPRSIRSYQREIQRLKELIRDMQWVEPISNSAPSCSCCGEMKHDTCASSCEAARITGDHGQLEDSIEDRR